MFPAALGYISSSLGISSAALGYLLVQQRSLTYLSSPLQMLKGMKNKPEIILDTDEEDHDEFEASEEEEEVRSWVSYQLVVWVVICYNLGPFPLQEQEEPRKKRASAAKVGLQRLADITNHITYPLLIYIECLFTLQAAKKDQEEEDEEEGEDDEGDEAKVSPAAFICRDIIPAH